LRIFGRRGRASRGRVHYKGRAGGGGGGGGGEVVGGGGEDGKTQTKKVGRVRRGDTHTLSHTHTHTGRENEESKCAGFAGFCGKGWQGTEGRGGAAAAHGTNFKIPKFRNFEISTDGAILFPLT
jgi:hypothetical protein